MILLLSVRPLSAPLSPCSSVAEGAPSASSACGCSCSWRRRAGGRRPVAGTALGDYEYNMFMTITDLMRRSMIEVYRLSGTKIHHPISILISCFCADCLT
jgi:hypothetical protein